MTTSWISQNNSGDGDNDYKTLKKVGIGTENPDCSLDVANGISGANLVKNGGFHLGVGTNWWLWAGNGANALSSADTGTFMFPPQSAKIAVSTGGASTSDVQFVGGIIDKAGVLVPGRYYTLSFWAKASQSLTRQAHVMNNSTYDIYASKTMDLTNSWQKFTKGFQLPGGVTDTLRIDFFLGGSGGTAVNFWIDGVTLVAGSASPEFNALTVRDDGEVIVPGPIGLGTGFPSKDLSFGGDADRTIGLERNSSADGKSLTVKAGGSKSGTTDKVGGDLILSSGISTGYKTSNIYLQTATAQGPISSLACTIMGIDSTPPNGGSGYSLNDVLNVVETGASGGIVIVTSVTGGVVTSLSFTPGQGGTGYTTGTQSTTGGTGSNCTVSIASVQPTPTNGGSNYAVNDVLAITGGNSDGQVTVSSVEDNAVTSLSLVAGGTGYTTGSKTTTGGSGTNCTVAITSVSSGVITGIAFSSPMGGNGYLVNDVLTVSGGCALENEAMREVLKKNS